ncbi:hypothetical protein ACTHGU_08210 [Chitinophagaceae bacterium MMS25-I14]
MKKGTPSQGKSATRRDRHMVPENKDHLDSRKNEEQDFKGGDMTHNAKDVKPRPKHH